MRHVLAALIVLFALLPVSARADFAVVIDQACGTEQFGTTIQCVCAMYMLYDRLGETGFNYVMLSEKPATLSDADADALRAQYPTLAGDANATCGSKLPTELR